MSSSTNLIDRSSPPHPYNRSHIIIHDLDWAKPTLRERIIIDIGW
ncbi:hypothetical protein [Chamaesiphon minutus]|nr:hypothetical protein [Chamaesiphon minutus]